MGGPTATASSQLAGAPQPDADGSHVDISAWQHEPQADLLASLHMHKATAGIPIGVLCSHSAQSAYILLQSLIRSQPVWARRGGAMPRSAGSYRLGGPRSATPKLRKRLSSGRRWASQYVGHSAGEGNQGT